MKNLSIRFLATSVFEAFVIKSPDASADFCMALFETALVTLVVDFLALSRRF